MPTEFISYNVPYPPLQTSLSSPKNVSDSTISTLRMTMMMMQHQEHYAVMAIHQQDELMTAMTLAYAAKYENQPYNTWRSYKAKQEKWQVSRSHFVKLVPSKGFLYYLKYTG